MDPVSLPGTSFGLIGRLVLAALFGAAMGINREFEGKSAGLRTHALVALGSGLAALVGMDLSAASVTGDPAAPARIIQGLVAGIGFIGGGVILQRGGNVHGLTTAASVWVAALVGTATTIGMWRTALAATVLAVLVLAAGRLDGAVRSWRQRRKR